MAIANDWSEDVNAGRMDLDTTVLYVIEVAEFSEATDIVVCQEAATQVAASIGLIGIALNTAYPSLQQHADEGWDVQPFTDCLAAS